MKKAILIVIIIITTQGVYAQESNNSFISKTTFGVKIGGIQNYINTIHINGHRTPGLYGGFFSNTRFHKKWSFQNEVNFSFSDGYNYIEIPFVIKYHINDKWSVFAGPKMDFILNDDSSRYMIETHYTTIGLSADIGMQYNLSKKIFIEARYSYNLTKQIDIKKYPTQNRQTFRLGIGFTF